MARPLLPPELMRRFFQTKLPAAPEEAQPGPGELPISRARWGRGARFRAAAAGLAVATLLFLGHPGSVEKLALQNRWSQLPEADRQPAEILLRRIDWAASNGQTAEVARLCAAFCLQHPKNDYEQAVRERRIEALMLLGDEPGVVDELHHLLQLDRRSPQLPALLLEVANWQAAQGAHADAAQSYTDLIAVATRADAWIAGEDASPPAPLGRSLKRWRAHQRAERSRTETERLARFNQALSFERAGEVEAAGRAYGKFEARFPGDVLVPEARLRGANLALQRGDTTSALASWRAVARDSGAGAALRTESALRAGRCEEARLSPEAAVDLYMLAVPLHPASDPFRIACLAAVAPLLEPRVPERAREVYRELIVLSADTAVRAAAQARLRALETTTAITAAAR